MTRPLIARVLMAADWSEAFRLVWAESFKAAAIPAPQADIVVGNLPSWAERRAVCLRLGSRCAEEFDLPELACAWTALAIDPTWPNEDEPSPERAKAFVPVYLALGDAIAEDPSLLDNSEFAQIVMGWRLMEAFGVGGNDPIVEATALGKRLDIDNDELLRWAFKWGQGGSR